ncbi:hypothetical protein K1T71_010560 [Dendrolimus kikuchii]|uniref:Uncharacterized protein n=1 Tax=Dendrolimus kikuchii TaxID=765133 RepID=A0ACC1CPG5_9NEOP|nr:hypothetical protein K1T71_010560 [Dendrolimus kikuchii]
MSLPCLLLTIAVLAPVSYTSALSKTYPCDVRTRLDAGWVCGLRRWTDDGMPYASFRGVPYAKQPFGSLKFRELQPLESWDGDYVAVEEGSICQQTDVLYGRLMQPHSMSEGCIYANVHVPLHPPEYFPVLARLLQPPYENRVGQMKVPILVFIHGGGFGFGSGDSDLHGPEYLISKNVMVVTFNYRLNVFGFLTANSTTLPKNLGLRDILTLLRWVQRNARAFGGDPDNVTLMGQSAGAAAAHLLTLSEASKGLFKRIVLMSGTGTNSFFTPSPIYAQTTTNQILSMLNINSTDPNIHQQLDDVQIEKINEANAAMLEMTGLLTLAPVIETPEPGVETILDDDPAVLVAKGRGKDIPMIIGFTNSECETFRPRFTQIDIMAKLKEYPILLVPPNMIYNSTPQKLAEIASKLEERYFNNTADIEGFIKLCSDSYYIYAALNLARKRAEIGGAPVYLYKFSYEGENSVIKDVNGLEFKGAGHIEDLTYVFKANSVLASRDPFSSVNGDDAMKYWMTTFIANFMHDSQPVSENYKSEWEPVKAGKLQYQNIDIPLVYQILEPSDKEVDMMQFFDSISRNEVVQNVISTAQGSLRGVTHEGYVSYNGIPYASASDREGRFKAAGLAPTWQGIRESIDARCHPSSNIEECLKLDVHVPTRQSQSWPVMVWIAGGGTGYNPSKLVQQGVIVVIVNHRTGPLGFLCMADDKAPGNAGVKDTVVALRWVRDNIVAFKGNPAKVTVAGQGFGAAMVEGLTLSPMAEGLYHGVILQSGSILCPWAFNHDAKARAKMFTNLFKDKDITEIKVEDLVENSHKLNVAYFPFGLCIENKLKRQERFLHEAPFNILVDRRANPVPMIIGYNSEEAYIFASVFKENIMSTGKVFDKIENLLPKELMFVNNREVKQVTKNIQDMYFKAQNISNVLKFYTDVYFTSHIYRSINLHVSSSHRPVYAYQFSHLGDVGVQEESGVKKTGAAHSDELSYLFDAGVNLEGDDEAVQTNMVTLWTNFVKYLNPSPEEDPVSWNPVNIDKPRLLEISAELKMIDSPNKKSAKMWDDIYEKFYYSRNSRSEN